MGNPKEKGSAIDYVYLCAIAFVVSLNSSTTIFWIREPDFDSSVFLYIAQRMFYGEMPYRDSFDHKGPLLYIFDYLAEMISPVYGPWLLDLTCMLVCLILFYLTARLILNNRLFSLILTTTAAAFIPAFYHGGNTVEIVAMPFISLAVYIYCKYCFTDSIKNYELILFGVSFAAVMLLRANMAAPWCIMCLAVIIREIRQKKAASVIRYFMLFAAGAAIVIVPVFVWLIKGHAFNDFVSQYILFNMKYSKIVGNENQEHPVYKVFFSFIIQPLIIASVLSSIYLCIRKKDIFSFSMLISVLFSTFLSSISGRIYEHYVMALIPLCIPALAYGIKELNKHLKFNKQKLLIVTLSMFILFGIIPLVIYVSKNGIDTQSGMDIDMYQTLEYIEEYTDKDDSIAIYGNRDSLLYLSNRKSVSKYSYQSPIAKYDRSILDSFLNDIDTKKPKLVIISGTVWGLEISDLTEHIKQFEYEKLPSPGGTIVVIRILS